MDTPTSWPDLAVAARTDPSALDELVDVTQLGLGHLRRVASRWGADRPADEALVALWLVLGRPDPQQWYTVVRARQRFLKTQRRAKARDDRRHEAERRFAGSGQVDAGTILDALAADELVAMLPPRLHPVARLIAEGASVHEACRTAGVGRQVWRSAVAQLRTRAAEVAA